MDPSGPLATLRKLLLSDESLASLQEWLQQHWWAVTLLLLAILVLLVSRAALGPLALINDHPEFIKGFVDCRTILHVVRIQLSKCVKVY